MYDVNCKIYDSNVDTSVDFVWDDTSCDKCADIAKIGGRTELLDRREKKSSVSGSALGKNPRSVKI